MTERTTRNPTASTWEIGWLRRRARPQNNLARRQGEAGNPTGAATSLAELLADQLQVLGPDHPYTLMTRNALAHWRERAGGE